MLCMLVMFSRVLFCVSVTCEEIFIPCLGRVVVNDYALFISVWLHFCPSEYVLMYLHFSLSEHLIVYLHFCLSEHVFNVYPVLLIRICFERISISVYHNML